MRLLLILPVMLVLTACQLALPGRGDAPDAPKAAAENPIVGGEIAVTALDGPAAPSPQTEAAVIGAPAKPGERAVTKPAAVPTATTAAPDAAPVEDLAAEPAAPAVVKTEAQLACEKRKGRWSIAGSGTAAFCQTPTKDAGKVCRSSDDCTGYCLAKSNTCAPVTPMLGCHDILNEAGRMLTQCIN